MRMGQSDFYTLMADRPQIVKAINRSLCRMVRGMLKLPQAAADSHLT